jgi:hypothetical protein
MIDTVRPSERCSGGACVYRHGTRTVIPRGASVSYSDDPTERDEMGE